MDKKCLQFGCGLVAPIEWENYDASLTIIIQRIPMLSFLAKKRGTIFPANVQYGDITKGLLSKENSCDIVYGSHVLEHLSYEGFHIALNNVYRVLKPDGIFRLVMPNLLFLCNKYIEEKLKGNENAANELIFSSGLGLEKNNKGLLSRAEAMFGNSRHNWLWDEASTKKALAEAGFDRIRSCMPGDSAHKEFLLVENFKMTADIIMLEARKPLY